MKSPRPFFENIPHYLPTWLNGHSFSIIAVSIIFIGIFFGSEPKTSDAAFQSQVGLTSEATQAMIVTPSATPFPPELIANKEQTNGILLLGIILVSIIVITSLIGIRRNAKQHR
jgi:hypothetical protein